ncbi:hypothetical protein MMC34_001822 [Xylographa carneopallida]|nr:hypothetical protein [Xylographa carneopallida]
MVQILSKKELYKQMTTDEFKADIISHISQCMNHPDLNHGLGDFEAQTLAHPLRFEDILGPKGEPYW